MNSLQNTRKFQPNHHHQMRKLKLNSRTFVNTLALGALIACFMMLAIAQNTSQTKCSEIYTRSQSEKINLLQFKGALARKLVKRELNSDDLEPNPGPEPTEVNSDNPENYAANSDSDANYQGNSTDGEEANAGSSASSPDYSSGDSDSTDATDLQPVHASSFHSSTPDSASVRPPSLINANHGPIRTPQSSVGPVLELTRHQSQSTTHNHHLQPKSGRPLQLDFSTTPSLSAQNVRRNAVNLPPTTTVPTMRFGQPSSNQQVRLQQQQQQQQQTQAPRLGSQEMRPSIPPSAFNVDMGADRMLIKPVEPLQHQQPQQRSTTIAPANMPTMSNIMDQETATETINQELSTQQTGVHNNGGAVTMMSHNMNGSNQRRQDLIYPTRLDDSPSTRHHLLNTFDGKNNYLNDLQPQEASQVQVPSICYTPLALLIVILVTMMITIVVCFCTHIVIRYLSRHQFDLIESSKQFDTKHGSSSSDGRSMEGAAQQQRAIQSQQGSTAILFNSSSSSNLNQATFLGNEDSNRKQSCMLGLFRGDQSVSPDSKALQKLRDEHGFAFDNPYFRDEPSNQRYLQNTEQQQPQQQHRVISSHVVVGGGGGLLQTATNGELINGHNNGLGEEQQLTGNEQLHFIEHHISNLHNRQVTSSVKELSILGSPENQNVAQVVDLTSEEQRSRILADPKEGDLIAVDISGHDIIGLGFDICGNQHDGVFVKSVFSRGPARESGCIETGDRIKCLNISFDNITLQDACDILNCGSPYKMRLLLEKRAAPPKLTDKLSKSPAPRKLYYGSQLALVPDGSNTSSINLSRYPNNNQQLQSSSGGALSITKNYFKRLANFVSPSNRNNRMNYGNNLDLRNQYDCRTSSNLNVSGISNSNELFVDSQAIPYLGSAAARRNLFSGDVPFNAAECINNQANSDTQTTAIAQQVVDPSSFEEAHIISRAPMVSNHPTTMKNVVQQRCLSHSDSIGSNLRGRFSVDSAEMLNVGSSTNDFNTDSSLDYQNRNANHRLHGPQFEQRIGNRMQVEDIADLRMIASQNQLNSHNRTTTTTTLGAAMTTTTTTNRRQSVACVMQTSGSGSIKANSKDRLRHHLEQTQSQPEIALRETSEDTTRETTSMTRPQLSEDVLATTSVDERIEILPNSRTNNPPTIQDTRNGRFQMISSVSTPSVNLLGSNNQQQQQTNSNSRTTTTNNLSSGDWRKIPSLRRKKAQPEESIREEIGGSDSSYADSTSKLVDRRQEQLSTGTSSNDTSANLATTTTNMCKRDNENSRPTVTQIARVLESRTESSSSSTATMTNNNNNNNHNIRDALTSLVNRNKSLLTERDDHV